MIEPPQRLAPPRRSALLRLGALCGLAGLSGLVSGGELLGAVAAANSHAGDTPVLLTREELALTGVLAELILPQTDTPGALAVGAHRTIDHLLKVGALAPEQARFKAGLARIEAATRTDGGARPGGFSALPAARQTALLHAIDSGRAPFDAEAQRFFRMLKGYVAFAYYTSEAGATRELAYLPVPGGFKGNFKVTRSTRSWAT